MVGSREVPASNLTEGSESDGFAGNRRAVFGRDANLVVSHGSSCDDHARSKTGMDRLSNRAQKRGGQTSHRTELTRIGRDRAISVFAAVLAIVLDYADRFMRAISRC